MDTNLNILSLFFFVGFLELDPGFGEIFSQKVMGLRTAEEDSMTAGWPKERNFPTPKPPFGMT